MTTVLQTQIALPHSLRTKAFGFSVLVLAIISLASLMLGAGPVAPGDALAVLVGGGSEEARFVLMELRLPRLAVGVTTGLALGVAGALLQAMTRNPLAEPGLLGVSAGSAFAVSLAILFGASTVTLTTLVAQAGALAGCSLVIAASRMKGLGNDPIRLVLAGATLSGLLLAMTSLLMLVDQRAADEIRFWVTGSIAGRQWSQLTAALPSLLLADREPDMQVVGQAASGPEALRKVEELAPDVVLMDISMQGIGGLDATAEIRRRHSRVKVLILTMHEDRRYLLPALKAGAAGYVVKRAADVELIGAIRAIIQRGEVFLHPSMAKLLVEEYRAGKATGPVEGQALSDRESEVLRLIAEGLSYKEMAERLGISVKTVETYRERIKEKLNLGSRAELVRYALDRGLLGPGG